MPGIGDAIRWAIIKRVAVAALQWLAGWLRKRAGETDPHARDLPPADAAEPFTRGIPNKPKVKVRTAKRTPPDPPPSLTS